MEKHDIATYGAHLNGPGGYIGQLGGNEYTHRFGGASWLVTDPESVYGGPTLLVTLDLHDPKLASLSRIGLQELPLASYINCSAWDERQVFRINSATRTVILVERKVLEPEPLEEADRFPEPLPERRLHLVPMSERDYPLDENSYYRLWDEFIGGSSFIRILGPPIWLQRVEEETCVCGRPMEYVASLGYENYDQPAGYLDERPFFIGEGALYFFLCLPCRQTLVISQST